MLRLGERREARHKFHKLTADFDTKTTKVVRKASGVLY